MSRKLFAILMALIIAASLVACNGNDTDEPTGGKKETSAETTTEANTDEQATNEEGETVGTAAPSEIGDPGEYSYTECDQTVYVNNPDSAVTLRSAEYKDMGSVGHGTELRRIGISTDGANYWSKIIYEEKEYYVASKFLTTLKDADEGFEDVEKTVVVNDKTGALNIRNVPSMESTIIGHANAGVEIKVIAENTSTGWYKIEFVDVSGQKKEGYIASNAEYFENETSAETSATTEATTEAATEATTEAATEATTESAGK